VLASNSPRRRELLALWGWNFEVRPAAVDESLHPGEAPGDYVLRLAVSKAQACAASPHPSDLIIAADTSVADGKSILGKPKHGLEAETMLRGLRAHTHQVYTGLALMRIADGNLVTELCVTDVPMRAYSDEELETYVASGDPLDKAGGYGIQHRQFHPVEGLTGCQASVMGLPLCHLTRALRHFKILPAVNLPARCQSSLDYTCPIFPAVLNGEQVG